MGKFAFKLNYFSSFLLCRLVTKMLMLLCLAQLKSKITSLTVVLCLLNTSIMLHTMGWTLIIKWNIDASWQLSPSKNIRMIIPRLIGELTWTNPSNNRTKDIKCKVSLQTVFKKSYRNSERRQESVTILGNILTFRSFKHELLIGFPFNDIHTLPDINGFRKISCDSGLEKLGQNPSSQKSALLVLVPALLSTCTDFSDYFPFVSSSTAEHFFCSVPVSLQTSFTDTVLLSEWHSPGPQHLHRHKQDLQETFVL